MKPIPEILADNARLYPDETALVEINPQELEARHTTWKEYSLVETAPADDAFRSEITWAQFEEKANRFANLLLTRGVKKGDKVAILLMNGLEWLPIYFGVLRTGALAVPLNFRYAADEIKYCVDLADASFLVFGPEFIGRVEQISDQLPKVKALFYVGGDCPSFAESYRDLVPHCSSRRPEIPLSLDDDAAICTTVSPALSSLPTNDVRLGYAAGRILNELLRGAADGGRTIRFASHRIVTRLSTDADALSDRFVAEALRHARGHLADRLDAATLARRIGYSKHMLQIRAERALGHTLGDEIRRMRLAAAKELVAETDSPIADIAEACGFTSVSHLALRFREKFAMTPLAWRRRSQGETR